MHTRGAAALIAAGGLVLTGVAFAQSTPNPTQQLGPTAQQGPMPSLPGHCRRPHDTGHQLPATKRRHESRLHRDCSFAARTRRRQGRAARKATSTSTRSSIDLAPPTQFGPEYLTYVLWAITPEGRSTNLGEVQVKDDEARIHVTTATAGVRHDRHGRTVLRCHAAKRRGRA